MRLSYCLIPKNLLKGVTCKKAKLARKLRVQDSMKIIFSRKGFDSGTGGAPSPIIDRRPISLPIPTRHRSETTYADLGLSEIVEAVTKGRIAGTSLCHNDPMFENNRCAFGQTGAAQAHLANNAVGVGDVFLFFGLFAHPDGRDRHHRLFGYLQVEEVIPLGRHPVEDDQPPGFLRRHPHTLGEWNPNNTLYLGQGQVTRAAHDDLSLSRPGSAVSRWRVPSWLREVGLTYHARADRWEGADTLSVAARGQEFVSDVGDRQDAHRWLEDMLSALRFRAVDE
jgi:putative DNA base modification enzyme with NMAD domain